jgi:3-hydroxyacyl-CoA dehydrogenase/enoyl-CoA hydratase/3-hydroxybutyryl-CoA epimerase
MTVLSLSTESGIAVLTLDLPGEPVNTLGTAVSTELEAALARLRDDAGVRAVVIISGKPDIFIAGADIQEFTRLSTAEEFESLSRQGQEMLQRLEDFPKPVVAAIHGACVGGGLELSLACHYRICTDHPKTTLGLPEIQLGLIPGAGGCQRLPRLIGLRAALDIILAGKSERGAKAYRLGIVDELVPKSILRRIALQAADRLAREGLPQRKPRGGVMGWLLERNPAGRRLVYAMARKQVLQRTGGHYPAPLAALQAVWAGTEWGGSTGYAVEHKKFGEVAVTDVSRKLIQIFFATTALKKDDGVPAGTAKARPVARLGVIGSGFMGAGIAGTAVSQAEVDVRLRDTEWPRVASGLSAATAILRGRLKRRRITKFQFERQAALLSGSTDYSGFRRTDLVIEAVFEDLVVKQQVLRDVEAASGPDTIFATNTSTIPIEQIAAPAARPERVIGMHFFSPVDRMPLLEVIPTARTSPETIVTAVQFGRKLGKNVIVVKDRPGFWVNRILSPYLNEAGRLLGEGIPIETLDRVMVRYGFPVGPITLLDEVGLDVAAKAGGVLHAAYGARLEPAASMAKLLADKRLGRKNGRGFYLYHQGQKTSPDETVYDLLGVRPAKTVDTATVERRLLYAMLNEAALAVADGVVRSPRDGDLGAIFGFGFPPFLGGPLRLMDDLGSAKVVETLNDLAGRFGERFKPAPRLVEMAARGGKFYSP